MSAKKFLKTSVVAISCIFCLSSFLSCGTLNGTTGEVLQTLLSSPDTEIKMPGQTGNNKKYSVDVEKQVKEADKDRKRQNMQPLKHY